MIQRYLNSSTTVRFISELLRRFWFLTIPIFLVTFLGALFESFGITILIPFLSSLSGVPYEAPNKVIAFFYGLISRLQVDQSPQVLLLLIFFFFVARASMLWVASFLQNFLSYKLSILLRQNFLLNAYNANWLFLIKQKFGHVQYIMSRDIPQVIDFLSRGIGLLHSSLLLVVYIVFAFMISPLMTAVALGSGLVFMLLLRFVLVAIRRYSRKIIEIEKDFVHYMYQLMTGIKMIKTGISRVFVQRQSDKFATDFTDASLRFSALYPLGTIFFQPLAVLIIFITFFFSYGKPEFNFAVFAVLLYLIYRVVSQIQSIQSVLQSLVSYVPHVSNFAEFHYALLNSKEEISQGGKPFVFKNDLKFSNVAFSYDNREPVFKDISFTVRKGASVGIIGSSGAGKTTLADLLLRLFNPGSGKILLDGVEANEFDLDEWRRNIGYVSQDPFLLHDTIRSNIKLYDESISDERVIEALEKSYIGDLIRELPQGLDTLVGDRGMMLSVGQRQRLILARVFARNPQLLILDEATSALDNESELAVRRAIDNLRGETTLFIIAHRLSTIMNVDHLLVLDKGRIIEEGKPGDLLSRTDSFFYKMYHAGDKK